MAAAAGSPAALADTYPLPPPGQSLVGQIQSVQAQSKDTLSSMARRFDLGYDAIVHANPKVDPWLPGQGTQITLPMRHILPNAPRKGIVLNLAEKRLYYYPKPKAGQPAQVVTHPVGIGVRFWNTPVGHAEVIRKIHNPTWYPPASIRKEHAKEGDILPPKVPPGPKDPLGHFALQLNLPGYLIHGTNKPYGIGMRVSHGCIRLYPEDIANLFFQVPNHTPVYIVNQPYKAGWSHGKLYLQAYPNTIHEGEKSSNGHKTSKKKQQGSSLTPMVQAVTAAAKTHAGTKINWKKAEKVAKRATGIPVVIGTAPDK